MRAWLNWASFCRSLLPDLSEAELMLVGARCADGSTRAAAPVLRWQCSNTDRH